MNLSIILCIIHSINWKSVFIILQILPTSVASECNWSTQRNTDSKRAQGLKNRRPSGKTRGFLSPTQSYPHQGWTVTLKIKMSQMLRKRTWRMLMKSRRKPEAERFERKNAETRGLRSLREKMLCFIFKMCISFHTCLLMTKCLYDLWVFTLISFTDEHEAPVFIYFLRYFCISSTNSDILKLSEKFPAVVMTWMLMWTLSWKHSLQYDMNVALVRSLTVK